MILFWLIIYLQIGAALYFTNKDSCREQGLPVFGTLFLCFVMWPFVVSVVLFDRMQRWPL